ncbi:MAG: DUF1926 domain-containing protein [Planctomycetes bacterium]|nr:DUF1926 domain-containing protein [Planctomycetota bacterium]
MKKTVNFILAVHNHQPVGNFDHIIENVFQRAYRPFLDVAERHPRIKLCLHYSGTLLEWIEQHHPSFIKRLKKMAKTGRLELLGGGFYEPMFSILSETDRRGQLELFSDYLKKKTGQKPQGAWLAERVWEQNLASSLSDAGCKYTVLDDFHFKVAGVPAEKLTGFFTTEEQGRILKVFPVPERLRYSIPFKDPVESINYLRRFASESGDALVVYAGDGEKFGGWPGTNKLVYRQKWLKKFFQALEENSDWINIITFSEALKKLKPVGRVYLPDASYREMTEWVLPAETARLYEDMIERTKKKALFDEIRPWLKGGNWRNFLVKYPEVNLLQAKMREVSQQVNALNKKSKSFRRAQKELYQGQSNCVYWHGLFGGCYLPHLRQAVYAHLLEAEKLARGKCNNVRVKDLDSDGLPEVCLSGQALNCYFKPDRGGHLYEFDVLKKNINLLATIARRPEAYHAKILKSLGSKKSSGEVVVTRTKGAEKLLYYDQYQRESLVDHFLNKETSLKDMARGHYEEAGDFVMGDYQYRLKSAGKKPVLIMWREGRINSVASERSQVIRLEKKTRLSGPEELEVEYLLKNNGPDAIKTVLAVEFNVFLRGSNSPKQFYYAGTPENNLGSIAGKGISRRTKIFGLHDMDLRLDIQFELDQPTDFWFFPVETVSQSESGFDVIFQSSVVLPRWELSLKPKEVWKTKIRKKISHVS